MQNLSGWCADFVDGPAAWEGEINLRFKLAAHNTLQKQTAKSSLVSVPYSRTVDFLPPQMEHRLGSACFDMPVKLDAAIIIRQRAV